MDLKVPDLKNYDRSLSKNLCEKHLNDNITELEKNQLADIDDQDKKIINSLLKNISKFRKENKNLREQNKNMQVELKSLQILIKCAQKDIERSKEEYKLLNGNNKSFSDALKNGLTSYKLNEADLSEETLKQISLVEERIFDTHENNGLFKLDNHN